MRVKILFYLLAYILVGSFVLFYLFLQERFFHFSLIFILRCPIIYVMNAITAVQSILVTSNIWLRGDVCEITL